MAAAPDRYARNLALARARFDLEVAETFRQVEGRVAHLFSGPLALLNRLAKGLFHHVGVREARKRVEVQFALHERAARDVPHLGLAAAVERHAPEILAHDDFLARIDRAHPAAKGARELVEEAFRLRLAPVARILHEGEGADFDALVRSTHTRAELEELFAQEFGIARRLMDLAEERDGLVRAPRSLIPRLVTLGRELLHWYETRVDAELDRIFPTAGRAGDTSRPG